MFRSNNINVGSIKRSDLENREFVQQTMKRNESILKHIPNSMQYWQSRKRDLFAMMQQLGKPTLFLTLGASEIHWMPLLKYVFKFQHNLDSISDITDSAIDGMTATDKAELINSDPTICCLYFDKLVDTIINGLKKVSGPFGKYRILDYVRRIEFQHRGGNKNIGYSLCPEIKSITPPVQHSEGPYWDQENNRLYYVDTFAATAFRWSYNSGTVASYNLEERNSIAIIIPIKNRENEFLVGADRYLYKLIWDTNTKHKALCQKLLIIEENKASNQYNDGKVDSKGRLWIGKF
ncbi:hypothetical protein NQ314_014586 [Rhamnusium bicolor]|uniref:Uncharacterized protein n=1 Tax=Rhamnusium bicolor TaxID=1586634 RepID=A0AAV8X1T9_9CUCU|nr:hypothetical protein NQ314_014586 [Rhamnusium bicolor]